MEPKLCNAGAAVRCMYKRNAKPHVACAYYSTCISEEIITIESHGKKLYDQLKEMN